MDKKIPIAILVCLLFAMSGFLSPLLAYVMSTGNGYRIQFNAPLDVSGGGAATSSSNFTATGVAGVVAGGVATSDHYKIESGYQQMQEVAISVGSPGDQILGPAFYGISGGVASASATWNMMTDNEAGFNATINVSTTPAMKLSTDGTYYLDDYTESVSGTPDFAWGVANGNAEFGFTVQPETAADTAQKFMDNNSSCNVGSANKVDSCWMGFKGTTPITIINRITRTSPAGENETIIFKAEANNKMLQSGDYRAQITVTVSEN